MANIDIDVDRKSIERTMNALKKGLRDGSYQSVDWGVDDAVQNSQDVIRTQRRIWNREVYHGFVKYKVRRRQGAFGSATNHVPHAYIVNYGRRPGARAPQVQHIIEWVDDKVMGSFSSSTGGGGSGGGGGSDDGVAGSADTAQEVSQWEDVDSTYRIHDDDADGFEDWSLFHGQHVVMWDDNNDEYVEGRVDTVLAADRVSVTLTDGSEVVVFKSGLQYKVVTSERWDSLDYDRKEAAAAQMLRDVPVDIDAFDDHFIQDIEDIKEQYIEIAHPDDVMPMGQRLALVEHTTPDHENPHIEPTQDGSIVLRLNNPNEEKPRHRSRYGKLSTIRHELFHVYQHSNGYKRSSKARVGGENGQWNDYDYWLDNDRTHKWNYVEQGGPENWNMDPKREVGPPRVYMTLSKEERNSVMLMDYSPVRKWKKAVYEDTLIRAQDSDNVAYDPTYDDASYAVLGEGGVIEEGGWLRIYHESHDWEFDARVEAVEREPFSDVIAKVRLNHEGDIYAVPVDAEKGEFMFDSHTFLRYGPPDYTDGTDDPDVTVDGIPEPDPGLTADDSHEMLNEAFNRVWFRQAIASETMDPVRYNDFTVSGSYSGIESDEIGTKWMEIVLDQSNGTLEAETWLWKVYENNPELILATDNHFDVPESFETMVENVTGMSYDDVIAELEDTFL